MKNISYFLLNRLTQTKTVATWTTAFYCYCETKRCFVSLRLAAFLQPAQAVFKLLSLKTAVLSTTVSLCLYLNYDLGFLIFACAAARRAIGTLNGEQET